MGLLHSPLTCAVALATFATALPASAAELPKRLAVLVGCTDYPALPERRLAGPANDVDLLRRVLTERFGFRPADVVALTETDGKLDASRLPTRKNIRARLAAVAAAVGPGDRVVVLLAGHGSRQPDATKPDGFAGIFLPRDIGRWDGAAGRVENAITEDELRDWVGAIGRRGAHGWLVIDSCHSGAIFRGPLRGAMRAVPSAELIPERVLAAVEANANPPRSAPPPPNIIALAAARASELAPEEASPGGGTVCGVLTRTVCGVLAASGDEPVTYRELLRRVHAAYRAEGWRDGPTPGLVGDGADRVVLGLKEWPPQSDLQLKQDVGGRSLVTGGTLRGLGSGTTLAVLPDGAEQPVGHVRVTEAGLMEARVAPCAFNGLPATAALPVGARCRVEECDYGEFRLAVAVDPHTEAGKPVPPDGLRNWEGRLREAADTLAEQVATPADPRDAGWFLRADGIGCWCLTPKGGWPDGRPRSVRPIPDGLDAVPALKTQLAVIARCENLKKAAAAFDRDPAGGTTRVSAELLLFAGPDDKEGRPLLAVGEVATVHDGDWIGVRLRNDRRDAVYVTLLYLDSDFGITCLHPRGGEVGRNLVLAGQSPPPLRMPFRTATAGANQIVVLAARERALESPISFSFLAQPTLAAATAESRRLTRGRDIEHPLARVLTGAAYGASRRSPVRREDRDGIDVVVLPFREVPTPRPAPDPPLPGGRRP